jgi:psp operon transcriptional activator
VVEYGCFLRVGGQSEISVRTRLVAATNSDLKGKLARGEFLPDLYDRLAFEVIRVPPLRERSGDIELLAQHFLERFMHEVPSFQGKHRQARFDTRLASCLVY